MTTLIPKYYEGATGSVNRPFNQKLQEFVSVEDFGAVGDGTTDDTAAIQAAFPGKLLFMELESPVIIYPLRNWPFVCPCH